MRTFSNTSTGVLSPLPRLHRLRFRFAAVEPMRLPAYTGSAWRGLLGRCLRQTACVTRQPVCDGCLLRQACVYSSFFESPPASPNAAARYTAMPHPFVLEPDVDARREVQTGDALALGVNLIGPATELVAYLIHAFQRAGQLGLGRDGGRFTLQELIQETAPGSDLWQSIYDTDRGELHRLAGKPLCLPIGVPQRGQPLRLQLQTPLRIKHHGRFVGPRHLTADILLRALIGRLAMLCDLYGSAADGLDVAPLFDALDTVQLSRDELRWHEWTRYSSRQRASMQMGGLIGRIRLSGDGLQTFWSLLWYGQWTHIGKGTSFGLGRYRIGTG